MSEDHSELNAGEAYYLDGIVLVASLSGTWERIRWPVSKLREGLFPIFIENGFELELQSYSTHRICEPPQVWLTLHDEHKQQWEIALEDSYTDDFVSARIKSKPTREMFGDARLIELTTLTTKGWVPIAWPRAEINRRHAPPFTLKGQPLKLISTEAHCVMQPSQLWLWLADEQGNRWHVTVEYRDGGVRARVIQEPTPHSSPRGEGQ